MSKAETYPSAPIGSTDNYLRETRMLDYSSPAFEALVQSRHWRDESEFGRIRSIYNFVRDEILFGYNSGDDIPASKLLTHPHDAHRFVCNVDYLRMGQKDADN